MSDAKWDARSHGGYLGHWFFVQLARWFGPGAAYAFVYPVALGFMFVARKERLASEQYLTRVLGPTHWPGRFWRSYQHLLTFGRCYLDGAMLAARGPEFFTVEHAGTENIAAMAARKQGGILLTAHLGAWELSSGLLKEKHGLGQVSLVIYRSDAEELQQYIEAMHARRPKVIAVGKGEFAALEILRAVRDGEYVAMQGDRSVDARDISVPFFGQPARWPVGPWVVAAVSGAPILWSFALRVGPRRYRFVADAPRTRRFDPRRPRDEQLREWVGEYVARLEEILRADPYQWFNFFDFWAAQPKLPMQPPNPPGTPNPVDR